MEVASRFRIVSRIPPASPAAIMLTNSPSKVLGCLRMASASDAPDSTSLRVCRMTDENPLSSSWLPRMSRHCTSGRPASIITENWRVKTARFFAATFLPFGFLALAAFSSLTGLTLVTWICSRRSAAVNASIESATRSPETVSPPRVRPAKANVGILLSPHRWPRRHSRRPWTLAESGAGDHADAAIDHVLQFVAIRRGAHRRLHRDQPFLIETGERLVRGLHAHLFLAGLHRAVDLMHLVVTNQV